MAEYLYDRAGRKFLITKKTRKRIHYVRDVATIHRDKVDETGAMWTRKSLHDFRKITVSALTRRRPTGSQRGGERAGEAPTLPRSRRR